jgi:hypothetical protein
MTPLNKYDAKIFAKVVLAGVLVFCLAGLRARDSTDESVAAMRAVAMTGFGAFAASILTFRIQHKPTTQND